MNESLLIVAGEVSGDQHAAAVLRALQRRRPTVQPWGIGGDALRAAGMEVVRHIREMETIGLTDALVRLPYFIRVFRQLLRRIDASRPCLAVLVDFPGFNLRLARALHARGIPVVYYICPQVWAWRAARIRQIVQYVRRLLVIFPFEAELFRPYRLHVDFVGHPLLDAIEAAPMTTPETLPWRGTPRIALLPGSRRKEIERILPSMLGAAARIMHDYPEASFIVAAADPQAAEWIERCGRPAELEGRLAVVAHQTQRVLRTAWAAWIASGTATLEAALLGCPMVIVYRTSALTYLAARWLVRVPYIGLVNLVAGRLVCPEFIQAAARADELAAALRPLLEEGSGRRAMLDAFAQVRSALGGPGAADRAAAAVAEELAALSSGADG